MSFFRLRNWEWRKRESTETRLLLRVDTNSPWRLSFSRTGRSEHRVASEWALCRVCTCRRVHMRAWSIIAYRIVYHSPRRRTHCSVTKISSSHSSGSYRRRLFSQLESPIEPIRRERRWEATVRRDSTIPLPRFSRWNQTPRNRYRFLFHVNQHYEILAHRKNALRANLRMKGRQHSHGKLRLERPANIKVDAPTR